MDNTRLEDLYKEIRELKERLDNLERAESNVFTNLGINTIPGAPLRMARATSGYAPIGITQGEVLGSSSMELQTDDSGGTQVTRIGLRGSDDNPDLSFYRGDAGAEEEILTLAGDEVDLFTIAMTDYTSSSTIVGWGSYTTQQISYRRIGRLINVWFYLQGTSNATTTTFTLPYVCRGEGPEFTLRILDSGVAAVGFGSMSINTATVNFYPTIGGGSWTASGTKSLRGQFAYNCDGTL